MTSLAKTIATLEGRREALVHELAALDLKLRAIAVALGARNAATGAAAAASQAAVAKAPVTHGRAAKKPRRSWFVKDEAGKLLRKAAKRPKAAAALVRELADLKGFTGKLSAADLRRFQGAAFMAVGQAVKSKALKRGPNGLLVAT